MGGNKLFIWVILFFYSQFLVSEIPNILLGGHDSPLGWGEMLFIYHLGGIAKVSEMLDVDDIKDFKTLNKFTVIIMFWPVFVNWREILKPKKKTGN